ncbi:hypothetical protein GCM10010123_39360 [Pilimelia anulata]|uniref:Uncharacterized protein n=1 Tax=Pilimelia anulata TaxID=53371 RepID=A0A8J3BA40_9ACTN|nr:tyrosinase family oxidase copper chaperone [Pilimelia anulata]GGK05569.1 hypothetical protein GCM10010123_39360 [Pilimelia anulata]
MSNVQRRDLLRYGMATAVTATAVVGVSQVAFGATGEQPGGAAAAAADDPRDFDKTYKGKKIKGLHDKANKKHKLTINGKKLGIMVIEVPVGPDSKETQLALLSTLTHYEPFPLDEKDKKDGLLKLAEKAVDTLGDAELTDLAGDDHDHR